MFNIAFNTFREIVRNRFLYLILVFAWLFILFSIILGSLALYDSDKVIIDFWLAMIEVFWLLGVLFVGSQLLFNEINGKTIFLILSKPIKRYEFILWKFLWFSKVILLMTLIQAVLFLLVLFVKDIEITKLIIFSLFFTFIKLEIILSLVLLLSTFMSNMLTMIVAFVSYIIGSSFTIIQDMVQKTWNEALILFTRWVATIFPPFEALNLKDMIWWVIEISNSYLFMNTFYSVVYLSLIMFVTVLLFNRKKFEG